ncbi:tRNA (adenosine(37)-N6)-dimethylallyltransferase MiaA [Pectinatus sottacetonis]|uniref:tRNA (adenosine(37)-N6)-dimethylallyltransferase MiaA n=1 Tax=Pectinatus sottacetonis TaxID=1002795 RepID=UPI0018C68055|nr:tRNA (adenosine(37)-N6)-dimethylallyltransferase MiaA [Pectinatus sottacetonis]
MTKILNLSNNRYKEKVVIILGPTAVGKTELSLKLAQNLKAEIISGDSMLVYKNFNIGTAKPVPEELTRVRHHLVNILSPEESFDVTKFCTRAKIIITELNKKNIIPVIAGGTGLYIKSLVEGYQFNTAPEDPEYRSYLETIAKKYGREYVLNLLKKVDPETAQRLHINNFRRIIRALEVYKYNKDKISHKKSFTNNELLYDAAVIGLNRNRDNLYARINERVDLMIKDGWVNEVASLLKGGVHPSCHAMQAIGYRQLTTYLEHKITLPEAIDDIKKATRHFAKRQLTWYKKMPYIKWFEVDKISSELLWKKVYEFIIKKFEDK